MGKTGWPKMKSDVGHVFRYHMDIWLVVWNMNFIFPHILGMSSFQLTKSIIFQRGRAQPPTSIKCPASRAAIPAIPHAIHHGVT